MKKILCVAIALMLMATCMVTVFADETPVLTVGEVEGKPGETVEVAFEISKTTFASYLMNIKFDDSALTLVNVVAGPASQGMFIPSQKDIASKLEKGETLPTKVALAGMVDYEAEGVLFTATFKIADDATEGTYDVTVEIDNISLTDFSTVEPTIDAGYVKVAHVHNYTAVVTEPDCVNGGYTTYTCSCGDSYVADETDPLGHLWGEWVDGEGNVCLGAVQVRTCERCGETETKSVDGLGHNWGEWTVTTPATCGEAGVETRTCSACGEVETRVVEATGEHSWSEWTVTTPATCGESGVETRTCSVCGAVENREVEATGEHTVTDWTVVTPADCVNKGSEAGYCSVCGKSVVRDIDALGHVWSETYEYDTKEHWFVCTVCGEHDAHESHVMVETEKVEHKTEEGYVVYTCKCGYSYKSTVPPTGDGNSVIIAAVGALAAVAGAAYVTMKRKSF